MDVVGFVCLFGFLWLVRYMGIVVDGRSVTSIVLCMLSWLTFLFVIPALSSYASRSMVALPSYKQVENKKVELFWSMEVSMISDGGSYGIPWGFNPAVFI